MTTPPPKDRGNPLEQALETIRMIAESSLEAGAPAPLPKSFRPPTREVHPPAPPAALEAKASYAARRRRDRAFGDHAELLADPAWDMMLDLYVAHAERRDISISSACIAACVPPTTALRWIRLLESRGLIERRADSRDGRRFFITLSRKGFGLIEQALA